MNNQHTTTYCQPYQSLKCMLFGGYTPPSVEAAIAATKEKAAKLCETLGKTSYVLPPTAADCAAAIRARGEK